jgi:hypothetical protein
VVADAVTPPVEAPLVLWVASVIKGGAQARLRAGEPVSELQIARGSPAGCCTGKASERGRLLGHVHWQYGEAVTRGRAATEVQQASLSRHRAMNVAVACYVVKALVAEAGGLVAGLLASTRAGRGWS